MLVYLELPSYGAWEFVDIPDRYVFDICNCICLLFCDLLGEFTVIVLESVLEKPCAWVNVSVCYQNILKRTESFPLTVDSLQNPRIISEAFVYLLFVIIVNR